MKVKHDQSQYWNKVANEKTFNHEADWDFLKQHITEKSKILDYGCGYGRLIKKFSDRGFKNIIGVDSSEKMIELAVSSNKEFDVRYNQSDKIPFEEGSFDLVLLFAVMTCIPLSKDQARLISEIKRIMKPNGLLYISDLLLNSDTRNKNRYGENTNEEYGVFELKEGAVFRHHSSDYLENELFSSLEIEYKKIFEVRTMNGNTSRAIQLVGRKS